MTHVLTLDTTLNSTRANSVYSETLSGTTDNAEQDPAEIKRLQDVERNKMLVRAKFEEVSLLLRDRDTKEAVTTACSRYAVVMKMEELRQRIMVALWTFTPDIRTADEVHALESEYLSFVFSDAERERFRLFNEAINEYCGKLRQYVAEML